MSEEQKDIKQDAAPAAEAEVFDADRQSSGVRLRKVAYISVILFFVLLSCGVIAVAGTLVAGVTTAQEGIVEPVGDLVQQLVLPATPVVLPNPATIVREINDLARLETASYAFEKVITAERGNQDLLWGALGESMVFVAHGKVFAGVDFAKMATEDLQVYDPVTVYVHLPEAEIFEDIPVLDNERSFVADRDTGLFVDADAQMETLVRQKAEEEIRAAALESEILERANLNAQAYVTTLLQGVGFENIVFTDEPPEPAPPLGQNIPKGFAVTPVPGS